MKMEDLKCEVLYVIVYLCIIKTRRTCERRINELQSVDLLQGSAEAVVKLAGSYAGIAVHCTLYTPRQSNLFVEIKC